MRSETHHKDIAVKAVEEASVIAQRGGPRSRSGRFDELDELKIVAGRVVREAEGALNAWVQWEAINDACADPGVSEQRQLFGPLGQVQLSLLREAILTCFRITEAATPERMTLTRLAKAIHDPVLRSVLESREWAIDLGYQEFLVDGALERNKRRARRLGSLLVADWKSGGAAVADRTLLDLRAKIWPLRNRFLAHSLSGDEIEHLRVDEFREFVDLVCDLASESALLFTGSDVGSDQRRGFLKERAVKFWTAAFEGILAR